MAKTVIGLMDNFDEAQELVDDLIKKGFNRDAIGIVAREGSKEPGKERRPEKEQMAGVKTGAGAGAAVGGIAGLLIGVAGLAIPGIGPIIAAGPIATALAGAGVGAIAGGLIGALTNLGVPEEEAQYYAEGVRRGGVLVTVETSDADADRAADIMRRHGAVDIDKRAEEWRRAGWRGFDEGTESPMPSEIARERKGIPVVEEEVRVGKRKVESGEVQARSRVKETPVEEDIRLREERAKVERRPVDRPLAAGEEEEAFRERSIDIPETAEEPVVSKEARVKEEVVLGKEERERTEKIRETKRRTEVEVERTGAQPGRGYDERVLGPDDEDFLNHFRAIYARTGSEEDYRKFRKAYYYGASVSREVDPDVEWREIEDDIHRDWEQKNPGTWSQYREAIHYGWEKEHRH
jgi:uncharacterized protein (TIGR02271 family)